MSKSSAGRFITLQELVEILGISKATFYKHQRQGVFPDAKRTAGGRLVFDQELIEQCQQVVRNRVGINGDPVIFQTRKSPAAATNRSPSKPTNAHDDRLKALASLGLSINQEQLEKALRELPADLPEPELIRRLFLTLKKQG